MPQERDLDQRTFGCFGMSAIFHVVAVALLALVPSVSLTELPEGTHMPETYYVDLNPAQVPKGQQTTEKVNHTREVMQAKNDDPSAVTVPPSALKVESPAEPVKKAEPAPKDVAVKAKAAAKKSVPASLPDKKPSKSAPKSENIADENGDMAVLAALESSRKRGDDLEEEQAKKERDEEAANDEAEREIIAPIVVERADQLREEQDDLDREVEELQQAKIEEDREMKPVAVFERKTPPAPQSEQIQPQPIPVARNAVSAPAQNATQKNPTPRNGGLARSEGDFGVPTGIRDASELAERPGNVPPIYPDRDRQLNNQGTAVFVALVNRDGTVRDVRLEKSAQSRTLDGSAYNAMARWRFMPGQQGWVRKAFTFNLGGDAQEIPARLKR